MEVIYWVLPTRNNSITVTERYWLQHQESIDTWPIWISQINRWLFPQGQMHSNLEFCLIKFWRTFDGSWPIKKALSLPWEMRPCWSLEKSLLTSDNAKTRWIVSQNNNSVAETHVLIVSSPHFDARHSSPRNFWMWSASKSIADSNWSLMEIEQKWDVLQWVQIISIPVLIYLARSISYPNKNNLEDPCQHSSVGSSDFLALLKSSKFNNQKTMLMWVRDSPSCFIFHMLFPGPLMSNSCGLSLWRREDPRAKKPTRSLFIEQFWTQLRTASWGRTSWRYWLELLKTNGPIWRCMFIWIESKYADCKK